MLKCILLKAIVTININVIVTIRFMNTARVSTVGIMVIGKDILCIIEASFIMDDVAPLKISFMINQGPNPRTK